MHITDKKTTHSHAKEDHIHMHITKINPHAKPTAFQSCITNRSCHKTIPISGMLIEERFRTKNTIFMQEIMQFMQQSSVIHTNIMATFRWQVAVHSFQLLTTAMSNHGGWVFHALLT